MIFCYNKNLELIGRRHRRFSSLKRGDGRMTKVVLDENGEPQHAVKAEVLYVDSRGEMATVELVEGAKKGFNRTVYLDGVRDLGGSSWGRPKMGALTKSPIVEGCILLSCITGEDLQLGKSILIPPDHRLAQA